VSELEQFLTKQIEAKDRLIAEQSATISRLVITLTGEDDVRVASDDGIPQTLNRRD
jgi:hypothetical protein